MRPRLASSALADVGALQPQLTPSEPHDEPVEVVRAVATARVLMPSSIVRLSAGRHLMSFADQALCFLAGANSIFSSERNIMLTEAVPCANHASDRAMLATMGLRPKQPPPNSFDGGQ